jgi:glycosyltransferase involved in cell wall biosynthesis
MNKVSCITVTKNRVQHLKKCIVYFMGQTHEDKELIIVYYNTDKDTEDYLIENKQELNNNNIHFYKFVEDEGLYLGAIRNFAINKATGDWLCIWDDDDYYSEHRIKEQLDFCLEQNLIGCTLRSILLYSSKLAAFKLTFERPEGWEGSLFVRRSKMRKYKNLKKGEDTPVVMYLIENGNFDTLFNPDLYVYMFHDANTSGNIHKETLLENSFELNIKKQRELHNKLHWL